MWSGGTLDFFTQGVREVSWASTKQERICSLCYHAAWRWWKNLPGASGQSWFVGTAHWRVWGSWRQAGSQLIGSQALPRGVLMVQRWSAGGGHWVAGKLPRQWAPWASNILPCWQLHFFPNMNNENEVKWSVEAWRMCNWQSTGQCLSFEALFIALQLAFLI